MFEVLTYKDSLGRKPYGDWLTGLADKHAKARVLVRVSRMAAGNFGDCKPVAEGVWELRIDWGPGYSVYYAQAGKRLVLLLTGWVISARVMSRTTSSLSMKKPMQYSSVRHLGSSF